MPLLTVLVIAFGSLMLVRIGSIALRMTGHQLVAIGFGRRGVIVLGITRESGDYVGASDRETWIESGDVLTVYGREKDIRLAFSDESELADTGTPAP